MRWLRPSFIFAGGLFLALGTLLAQPLSESPSSILRRSTDPVPRPHVVVVLSEASLPYQEAALAIQRALRRDDVSPAAAVQVIGLETWPIIGATPSVLIALGSAACDQVAAAMQVHSALLCALLPLESFERILQQQKRKASPLLTALVLNQPPWRQLNLIRLALPTARRVGVLWGPQSLQQASALRVAAQNRGLELREAAVTSETQLAGGLRSVLAAADVLLAIADPLPYNSMTLQSILQTAMRERVPIAAFSPAYARAGALLSLYATPTQVGDQAAALVRQALRGKPLPAEAVNPVEFSIDVNAPVARALGLSLDANDLLAKMRKAEGLP